MEASNIFIKKCVLLLAYKSETLILFTALFFVINLFSNLDIFRALGYRKVVSKTVVVSTKKYKYIIVFYLYCQLIGLYRSPIMQTVSRSVIKVTINNCIVHTSANGNSRYPLFQEMKDSQLTLLLKIKGSSVGTYPKF